MTNQPREQIEANLRRAELTALCLAVRRGKYDAVALALVRKYPEDAKRYMKEREEMALKK